ncbi:MAG: hypothetical protein JWN70_792 [Planctomycetaceae bacterium]|nr:hypothetical protein [Planctomycetaceae bacterium]
MLNTVAPAVDSLDSPETRVPLTPAAERVRLQQMIEHVAKLLPAQGPLTAFVFINTLQALEDLPFDEGLRKGARLFRCQPYLSEDRYRQQLSQGRIKTEDLISVLLEELDELGDSAHASLAPSGTKLDLWMAMLRYPLRSVRDHEMRWFLAETHALKKMREETLPAMRESFLRETRHWVLRDLSKSGEKESDQAPVSPTGETQVLIADLLERLGVATIETWTEAQWENLSLSLLWRICRHGVHGVEVSPALAPSSVRHRDLLLEAAGEDSDVRVHEILIRFCAAFADQGLARWSLPNRDAGFFRSFASLYEQGSNHSGQWMEGLSPELARIQAAGMEPIDSVYESLDLLGVAADQWEDYLQDTLLALRGWAGQIWQMETREDRVAIGALPGTLIEFLAVRLILERLALSSLAKTACGYQGELKSLADFLTHRLSKHPASGIEQRAFLVFQLAQFMGWTPQALHALSKQQWTDLIREIEAVSSLELRRILHLAFERRFRTQTLNAFGRFQPAAAKPNFRPRFQATFCIDAREESFRRHLEEVAPDTQTFGLAGFYGVAMYYRGIADANFAALCPIVIRPQHWVIEDAVFPFEKTHKIRSRARRALGAATYQIHVDSRTFTGGTVLTAGFGVLASIPLVARVLFPSLTAKIRQTVGRLVQPPPLTRLRLERHEQTAGPEGGAVGFSVSEMANIGERMLRDIGLTTNLARLVIFLGHGSFCLNNPQKSAYDCGACSGSAGGPNARALAAMLNEPRVREILSSRGLTIPADTVFVGGLHNTADDTITLYDLDLLPHSHSPDVESARQTFREVCRRNAHERCRRFESAPLQISLTDAHRHVKRRSEDLAQPRPEYGNASNAICFVGRRERSRGLYLDRRSFMQSYDPTQDDADFSILLRIMGAVVPVCSGINLQYFFASVDSEGWACGSKLPHNVTSLLGVMDGAQSDLRCGLPTQGVEIHEPVRLLFLVETTPVGMQRLMEQSPVIGRILRNGWAQLAVLDPNSSQIQIYRDGEFHNYEPDVAELPQAASSFDWYGGWRDHLPFAEIASQKGERPA